jgi:hypothetical protein
METMDGKTAEQKPAFKTRPIVSVAPITRHFIDVAKDDSVRAQLALAMKGYRCRDIHQENQDTVRITIEDGSNHAQDIQAILDAAVAQPN